MRIITILVFLFSVQAMAASSPEDLLYEVYQVELKVVNGQTQSSTDDFSDDGADDFESNQSLEHHFSQPYFNTYFNYVNQDNNLVLALINNDGNVYATVTYSGNSLSQGAYAGESGSSFGTWYDDNFNVINPTQGIYIIDQ